MSIQKLVREAFYQLLLEQEESGEKPEEAKPQEAKPEDKPKPKPKPKRKKKKAPPGSINIAQGSLGRGRFSAFVTEAGARSSAEPDKLMKDLGVKSGGGGSDVDRVRSVLQPALSYHPLMRSAFAGASSGRLKLADETEPVPVVRVSVAEISTRNGIKFISHTLEGAKNAGMLSLDGAVEIGLHDGEIFLKSV